MTRRSYPGPEGVTRARSGSLSRRITVALTAMLLPLFTVVVAGVVNFRTSVVALEDFRDETVGEARPIERVRELLDRADDVGEKYVEGGDPLRGTRFREVSGQIDRSFAELMLLNDEQERKLATSARSRWEQAFAAVKVAVSLPADRDEDRLDAFHDLMDEAGSLAASLYSLQVNQVANEIELLHDRERQQMLRALAVLLVSSVVAGLLARRFRRSITIPLASLEKAASQFGSAELSHRISVTGHDELARVSVAFNDMAGRLQESRDELHELALHDPLTGLPNRALFSEQMERAIARSDRRGTPFALLYLDLDDFKTVNDTLGHEAGDELLVAIAERLRGAMRAEDTAARLGGDEFVILLEETDLDEAVEAAERLTQIFRGTWSIATGEVAIAFSIGVAIRLQGEDLDQLVRQADTAMYAAKAAGKGQWQVFGPDLVAEVLAKQTLKNDLERAVERGEFVIHYQPIINLKTGAIEGVESLVRWAHPERGLLLPSEFLQAAEEGGHILFIDKWVLVSACRQVREWQERIPAARDLRAYVNISASQLHHPGLDGDVAEALSAAGLAPEALTLEITETALASNAGTASTELGRLKELGVKLALDDFGTGYSSLTHLLTFPIDVLKIDRSFVSTIGGDGDRSDLALAIVNLAKTLQLKTVAEGVEREDQFDFLRSLGCDLGQGYYFAKPLDQAQLETLLHARVLQPV